MTRLPKDLRFYTFAIPTAALAGWGYADSFNTYGNILQKFRHIVINDHSKSPEISYDGLVMKSTSMKDNSK